MNENLDLTELLKDCPKGTKLYSPAFGECTLEEVTNRKDFPIKVTYKIINNDTRFDYFTKNGYMLSNTIGAECMLFPSKDRRDWSKWQGPFKDGDVVYANVDDISYILIYYKQENNTIYRHVCFCLETNTLDYGEHIFTEDPVSELRFATEEEKQKLFNAIKEDGHRWNSETKTLEYLTVPKFKVGDKIKHKFTGDVYKVLFVQSNECGGGAYDVLITNEIGKIIDIEEQDNYELIPNKFDPQTLQPFDKVLCRMNNDDIWGISLFERYAPTNPYPFFCIQDCFSQCVPYNDNTKHLVGTNNEAPEYYKCWED